jgi:hypothetical protein
MLIKLEANMQGCPNSGYVAWIENSRNFSMVVQGDTPENATKELIKSLKVSISYIFGADINSISEKEVSGENEYLDLLSALRDTGKKELNFKLATA